MENAKPWDVNMKEKREGLVETVSASWVNMKKKKYRVVESWEALSVTKGKEKRGVFGGSCESKGRYHKT